MIPGEILAIIIPAIVVSMIIRVIPKIIKARAARRIAIEAGMDPGHATTVALTTDDGLESTYLAANLRERHSSEPSEPAEKSAADRLKELEALQKEGLISASEYHERRRAIIDGL